MCLFGNFSDVIVAFRIKGIKENLSEVVWAVRVKRVGKFGRFNYGPESIRCISSFYAPLNDTLCFFNAFLNAACRCFQFIFAKFSAVYRLRGSGHQFIHFVNRFFHAVGIAAELDFGIFACVLRALL